MVLPLKYLCDVKDLKNKFPHGNAYKFYEQTVRNGISIALVHRAIFTSFWPGRFSPLPKNIKFSIRMKTYCNKLNI